MTRAIDAVGYSGPVSREVVTPPTVALLSIAEVRGRLRLPFEDEDADLERMTEAAVAMVEDRLGRRLLPQVVRWWYDAAPSGRTIWLPEPVRSVESLTTYGEDGTPSVVTSSAYHVDTRRARVVIDADEDWPQTSRRPVDGFAIEAAVGYADAFSVPRDLVEAVLLQVMALYQRDALKAPEHGAYMGAIAGIVSKHAWRVGVA